MDVAAKAQRGEAGFSLLEILVALGLFALISLAGVILVSSILQVRDRTEGRLEELGDLQRGLVMITSDFHQAIPKSIQIDASGASLNRYGEEGRVVIRYTVDDGRLLRILEKNGVAGARQTLLDKVSAVRWRVLTRNAGWSETWPSSGLANAEASQVLRPVAVAVELDLDSERAGISGTLRRIVELTQAP
jgi:general secretion pathway protein J